LLKNGNIVAIFIEGPRSLDGKLKKGKTGVARLALTARVPILPPDEARNIFDKLTSSWD
jgi:1-acyl-sn-glycerol-3-phosphate acyltransferase